MKYLSIAMFALLLLPSAAAAQVNVKNPYKVQFCFTGKDDGGNPITLPVQVRVTIDTTAQPMQPLPTASGTTGCPTGASLYIVSGYSSTKGNHTASATLWTTDGESLPSNPFDFTVIGRPPASPTNLAVTQ